VNAIAKPPLNRGQTEAAEGFFQFLFSDDKEMIISGPGGYGKTFLMGHLIDEIMPRYYDTCKLMGIDPQYDAVEMTATTNKAAEALSLATGRPTSTVHSYMNLKVSDDFETGQSKLTKTTAWTVHERVILFIDEYSLVDTPLDTAVTEGTHNCKIVWVGDHCQMAPITETVSPIDRKGLRTYVLTEPMRNNGQPALMALCKQMRNTVETGLFLPIQCVPGVIDWLSPEQMEAEISSVFGSQDHDNRILTYTNRQTVSYNDFIRGVRQLPDEWTTGERLVNNSAIQFKDRMLKVEEEVSIHSQAGEIEDAVIDTDVSLKVRRTVLQSKLGELFRDVKIPVDREHFESLKKYYSGQRNWNRFFHLKNKYPDLRQRDASTVYKAQGSTLDTVYIDVGNISACHNPNQTARMLNVAVSRPRNRIAFYGKLAEKYGGLIQ
jgi:hypothetical protein